MGTTVTNNILHDTGVTCTVAVRNHCQGRHFLKSNTVEQSTVAHMPPQTHWFLVL
jgi:hypothetical protein